MSEIKINMRLILELKLDFIISFLTSKWIATPELQPRINALADEFKLKRKAQYTEGKGVLHFKGKIDHYSGEVSEVRDGFHKYDDLIHVGTSL